MIEPIPKDFSNSDMGPFFEPYTPRDLRFVLLTKILKKDTYTEDQLHRIFRNVELMESFINKAPDGRTEGGKSI